MAGFDIRSKTSYGSLIEEEREENPHMAQSREQLTMDMTKSENSIFKQSSGCFVSRTKGFGLTVLCLVIAALVGFITYQVVRCPDNHLTDHLHHEDDDTTDHTPSPKVKDVRLPRNVEPIYYKVDLIPHVDKEKNFTIEGSVAIDIMALEPSNKITIHIKNITINEPTVTLVEKNDENIRIALTKHEYDEPREFYNMSLDRSLEVGKVYTIRMKFTGELNDDLAGFYRSSYADTRKNETRWLGVTQFQPTDARRAFPCFDEPALKAEFEVSLARKTHMSTISNMDLKSSNESVEGMPGWVWDHYKKSVPMSTYLVAFVVSDFESRESDPSLSKPMFRVWARKEAIDQVEYAREIGPKILTYFEKYFNIDFPLPKQDMIALPDFNAGAMENWGLITYRETAMLYDEKVSSDFSKQRVATVISHELAHQWFGNLVTPSWWTDLWLNEGFASYVEYLGVNHTEPEWRVLEQFVTDDLQNVFGLDALDSSHPISVPVTHPDEINEIFDRISYGKGASIIRMMNHFLSETTFTKGLTNYLNKWKFNSTKQDNLWESLTEQAYADNTLARSMTVADVMDTWTLQKGFPVVNVDRHYEEKTAEFSQTKFQLIANETMAKIYESYKWWVPISYASKSHNMDFNRTEPEFWISKKEKNVTKDVEALKTEWLIVNVQETGYYRVNYDTKNWQLIVDQLVENGSKIHTVNRAQLLDDALNLARASLLSYDLAFNVTQYLKDEDEYLPWESFLNSFGYISSMLQKSPAYGLFKKYVLELIGKQYERLGFLQNSSDPFLKKFHRINILQWACSVGHSECVKNAQNLFSQWMNQTEPNTNNPVPTNQRRLVYCSAIRNGGEKEWDFAWNRYLEANVASEKSTILSALACSKETWILNRYLNWSVTPGSGIRKQDGSFVIRGVATNEVGNFLAFNFLRDKWHLIKKYFGTGSFSMGNIVKSISQKLNTPFELQELEAFKHKFHNDLGAATRAVDQAIEGVSSNVRWMDDNFNIIFNWLKNATSTLA